VWRASQSPAHYSACRLADACQVYSVVDLPTNQAYVPSHRRRLRRSMGRHDNGTLINRRAIQLSKNVGRSRSTCRQPPKAVSLSLSPSQV